ncbi:MAG: hypothetical protein J0I45_22140 [Bosea sp.]|nr:hypothetical protein [Bosea sp. (in: a-proteobacteria)]
MMERHGDFALQKRNLPPPHQDEFFFEIGYFPEDAQSVVWEKDVTYPSRKAAIEAIDRRIRVAK